MDAENAASTSKEDAVSSKDAKGVETDKRDSACLNSASVMQVKEKDESNSMKTIKENESQEIGEEAVDLLEKIEEVVKGNIISLRGLEEEISEASEQDFLKKIEEEMKNSEGSSALTDIPKTPKDSESIIDKNEQIGRVTVNKEIFVIEDDDEAAASNVKNSGEIRKPHTDDVIVNNEIFAIEDDSETSSRMKKPKECENPRTDDVIVNKEIFVIEDDHEATPSNVKESDEIRKSHTDDVIVNKEIFVIEDDDDATARNEKKSEAIQKSQTASNKTNEIGNSSEHAENMPVSSLSEINHKEINKDGNTLKIQKEGVNQAIAAGSVKEKQNEEGTAITTVNQINKMLDSAKSYLEKKLSDQGKLESQISPMNVEYVQQQQSIDLSKIGEPMCVDSNESSNDGKMEVDVEEKLEMDIDNENGRSNVVYNDQEMRPIDSKAIENEIQNQSENISEIQQRVVVSQYKLQQGGGEVKNLCIQSEAKESLVEITVKVNVETGGTSSKTIKTSEIRETVAKDSSVLNNALENVNSLKTPEALAAKHDTIANKLETIQSGIEVTEKISESVSMKYSENKSVNDELDSLNSAKDYSKHNASSAEKSNDPSNSNREQHNENVENIIDITSETEDQESPTDRNKEIREDSSTVQNKPEAEKRQKDSEHLNKANTSVKHLITVSGADDDMKIENKLVAKMKSAKAASLTNSPIPQSTANVFNSTPIAKQFEISSENVSKISDALENSNNRNEHGQSLNENPINISETLSVADVNKKLSSLSSSTETGSDSQTIETDNQSSSGIISKFINSIKNGIADSTTTDDGGATTSHSKIEESSTAIPSSAVDKTDENMYEVSMWCEKNDVKFLSVKRLEKNLASVALDKTVPAALSTAHSDLSSNGSVSSLPQFSLPQLQKLSSSGSTTTESGEKTMDLTELNKSKHLIKGLSELCAFMINHFTKIRSNLPGPSHKEQNESEKVSGAKKRKLSITPKPKTAGGSKESTKRGSNRQQRQSQSPAAVSDSSSPISKEGRSSKMSCESPLSVSGKNTVQSETPSSTRKSESRSRKRSIGKVISEDDEEDGKPKSKQAKRVQQGQGDILGGQCVLAKWVDRKYYAGRILEAKPGNKFVVRFEDGASKVLQKDLIVFGSDDGTLPLKDHKIHALVDDDYECGVVISIDKVDEKVLYTVKAETATVKVTASDIYLQDDQAKIIQNLQQNSQSMLAAVGGGAQDLLMNTFDASALSLTSGSMTRNTRHKRISGGSPITTVGSNVVASPEPGTSSNTAGLTGKKGGKRQKRLTTKTAASVTVRMSESSDITDTSTKSSQSSEESDAEVIEGVQQEYQKTPQEIRDQRMIFIYEYKSINPNINVDEILGVLPATKSLFKNKCFLLTCTAGLKPHLYLDSDTLDQPKRNMQFSRIPFLRNILTKQIEEGGGKIYNYFKDIPKSKYRQCVLIAPRPCCTAKYIQCLAANIQAVSHEWIIDSCKRNVLLKKNEYALPAGWSILLNKFTRWQKGKSDDQRQNIQPFTDTYILLASGHESFLSLWSRICKLAGGTIRYIKSIDDITPSTQGYMVTDSDFPDAIRRKAEHFGIPIVSSVWIVQSLVMGRICSPDSHIKLSCTYSEDDDM